MLVASDDATSGSVIAKPERISAASSGSSQRCFVLVAAVAREHFHVARVGRAAVEHFGRDERAAHHLAQRRVLAIGQARRRSRLRAGTDSTAPRARLACSSSMTGGCAQRVAPLAQLLARRRLVRVDVGLHERFEAFAQRRGGGDRRHGSSFRASSAEYRALARPRPRPRCASRRAPCRRPARRGRNRRSSRRAPPPSSRDRARAASPRAGSAARCSAMRARDARFALAPLAGQFGSRSASA